MYNYSCSRASLIAQLIKNPPAVQETLVRKILWRRDRLSTPVFLGFPGGLDGKESACNVGNLSSIPGLGRCPEEGKGYPCQCSGLENSPQTIVHGVTESWTWLSNSHSRSMFRKCWCSATFVSPSRTFPSLTYYFIYHNLPVLRTLRICLRRYWFFPMSPRYFSTSCFPGSRALIVISVIFIS